MTHETPPIPSETDSPAVAPLNIDAQATKALTDPTNQSAKPVETRSWQERSDAIEEHHKIQSDFAWKALKRHWRRK